MAQDWKMRLYLASTSPARLQLLRNAGINPVVISPGVDESAAVAAYEREHGVVDAQTMVQLLARAKAEAVVQENNSQLRTGTTSKAIDGIVIGGDSAFFWPDGTIHGKPHTSEAATVRWQEQNGGEGTLWSGHWVIDHRGGKVNKSVGRAAAATVKFATLDEEEIRAYVASGEPLEVAGAFTLDSLGGPFIREIIGDPSTVIGLSLSTLRELIRELGISWPEFWDMSDPDR